MKTKRNILFLGLLMVSLVIGISCEKKAGVEEPNDVEEPHEELVVEPLVGIGPVQFGMTKDQVIDHFGQPDKIFEGQVTKLHYVPSQGLNFAVDAQLGLQEIGCWSEGMLPSRVTTFAGKTKEGIRIGATEEDIVNAYGEPDRTSAGSRGIIQNLHYDNLSAKFSIKDGKLMSMVFEAPK